MIDNWQKKCYEIPLVCAINTFNNELTIYACLQQAHGQFDKIIVVDDGSKDRTIAFIRKFCKDFNVDIPVIDVSSWDPWPDQKIERDHGKDKGKIIESGKTHAKSKFKSWAIVKKNFPNSIYVSLEADVILCNSIRERMYKRISKWDDPLSDCEFFNVVFTIDSDYVRPVCASETDIDKKLEGIKQRKIYDQPGDWTFACFYTGGNLKVGPDPVWPYGACLFPWSQKNQCEKKGQDVDIPYGFHLYNYNNKSTDSDFSKSLILAIKDIDDKDVDWLILKKVWFPKIFFIDKNNKRSILTSSKDLSIL